MVKIVERHFPMSWNSQGAWNLEIAWVSGWHPLWKIPLLSALTHHFAERIDVFGIEISPLNLEFRSSVVWPWEDFANVPYMLKGHSAVNNSTAKKFESNLASNFVENHVHFSLEAFGATCSLKSLWTNLYQSYGIWRPLFFVFVT